MKLFFLAIALVYVAARPEFEFPSKTEADEPGEVKVIPQFCIAHSFCAYFNNKSLRNIFKMAAFNYKKINRKKHEKVAFLSLREFPKRKTVSKLETNSSVKVLTK